MTMLAVASAIGLSACPGDGGSEDGARRSAPGPDDARACLRAAEFRVVGGRRSPGDVDAPDYELIVGAEAFVGFYDDLSRAKRYEPEIRKHSPGPVERRGKTTVAWIREPSEELRDRVYRCVF